MLNNNLNLNKLNAQQQGVNNSTADDTGLTVSCVYNLLHNDSIVRWAGSQISITSPNILTNVNKAAFRSFTGDLLPFTSMDLPELHCDVILNDNINSSNVTGYLKSTENVYQATSYNYNNQKLNKLLELTKAWTYESSADSQVEHNIEECVNYINQRFNTSMYPNISNILRYNINDLYDDIETIGSSVNISNKSLITNGFNSVPLFVQKSGENYVVNTLKIDSTTTPTFDAGDLVTNTSNVYINFDKNIAVAFSSATRTKVYIKSDANVWSEHFDSTADANFRGFFISNKFDNNFNAVVTQWSEDSHVIRIFQKYVNINSIYELNINTSTVVSNSDLELMCAWYDNIDSKIYLVANVHAKNSSKGFISLFSIAFSATGTSDPVELEPINDSSIEIDSTTFSNTMQYRIYHNFGEQMFTGHTSPKVGYTNYNIQGFGKILTYTLNNKLKCGISQYLSNIPITKTQYIYPCTTEYYNSSHGPLNVSLISGWEINSENFNENVINISPELDSKHVPHNMSRINSEIAVLAMGNFSSGIQMILTPATDFNKDHNKNSYHIAFEPGRSIDAQLVDNINSKTYNLQKMSGSVTCNEENMFIYNDLSSISTPYIQFDDKSVLSMSLHIYTEPFYFDLYTPISYVQTDNYTIFTNPSSTIINLLNQEIFKTLEYLILLKYEYNDLQLRVNNFPNSDNVVFTNNEICNVMFKEMNVNGNSCTLIINVCDSDGNAIDRETLKQLYGKLALCIDWVQE